MNMGGLRKGRAAYAGELLVAIHRHAKGLPCRDHAWRRHAASQKGVRDQLSTPPIALSRTTHPGSPPIGIPGIIPSFPPLINILCCSSAIFRSSSPMTP